MPVDLIGYAYAAVLAGGGVIGYAKSASLPSLAAGLISGSLAALGAYQTSQNPKDVKVTIGTSIAVMNIMGFRYIKTKQFIPAGPIGIISFLMVQKCAFQVSGFGGIFGKED